MGLTKGVVFKRGILKGCSRIQWPEREAEGWGTGGGSRVGELFMEQKRVIFIWIIENTCE